MDPTVEESKPAAEKPANDADPAPTKAESAPAKADPAAPVRASKLPSSAQLEELFASVRRLETFAADEAKRVSGKLVPQVEEQAKKNIWVSLLLALGLGLILGIWLTGGRRRD